MTLAEFNRAAEGYSKRLETEARQTDQLNHILGQYIAAGVNDPKKYPKKPLLSENSPKPKMSVEAFRQLAKQRYEKKE